MTDMHPPEVPARPRPRPAESPRPQPPPATGDEIEIVPGSSRTERRQEVQSKRRAGRSRRLRWLAVGVALCVIAATAVVTTLLLTHSDHKKPVASSNPTSIDNDVSAQIVDPQRATAFLAGATSDISAVTTYDYRTLDAALNAGLAVTTGGYQKAYRSALTGSVATSARLNHTVQTFDLLKMGIGTISGDGNSAKVLVFGTQHVTDKTTGPTPRSQVVTLTATILRTGPRYLISALDSGTSAGLPTGTTGLGLAAEAGRKQVVNLMSYRRATFAEDEARALAGAINPLRAQILRNAASTKAALVQGSYDLVGSVTAVALERAQGTSVVLLMAATESRVSANGVTSAAGTERYEVTVVRSAGKWLTSTVTTVQAN